MFLHGSVVLDFVFFLIAATVAELAKVTDGRAGLEAVDRAVVVLAVVAVWVARCEADVEAEATAVPMPRLVAASARPAAIAPRRAGRFMLMLLPWVPGWHPQT